MKMRNFFILIYCCLISCLLQAQTVTGPQGEVFAMRVVASGLSDPWEVTYGPDNYLWVTESKSYRISRIDPAGGTKTLLLDVSSERQFPRYDKLQRETGGKPWPQGGLMGMALHPQLLAGKPYVYIAYHYRFLGAGDVGQGCAANFGGCFFTARIVRYEYDRQLQKLAHPVIICDSLPASSDHNGGRLLIAPVAGKLYLFYSIGEMGAGQFDNAGRPNHAQQPDVYEGKILRFNTEPDKDTGIYDCWIPNDNPFNTARQSAVYSYGHRNPQGLAYAVTGGTGKLYESEHGPFSDDEINIIERGRNYGHPLVIGFADGNYDSLAAGVTPNAQLPGTWHTAYPQIVSERENAKAMGPAYHDPMITLYPSDRASLLPVFVQIKTDGGRKQWSSEAPASIDVYTADAIPGWKNSLLLPSLKHGHLVRLQLNAGGNGITGDTLMYFKAPVRYRDIALSADGKKIYLCTDSAAISSGPSRADPKQVSYQGCIIEYSYQGMKAAGTNATGVNASPAKKEE